MNYKPYFVFFLYILFSYNFVKAEEPTQKQKFKVERIKLIIGANYGIYTPIVLQNDRYIGAAKLVDSLPPSFIDYHSQYNLRKKFGAGNMQFTLQANFWKGLYNGLHYQFFSIKNYKRHGRDLLSKTNTMFFSIATSVGYSFEFLKNKNLQIMPTFRIGGYAADAYYDNLGGKLYLGLDCKFRYFIKNKFGFSAGIDYDFFHYKAKGFDDRFQKETFQKTTLNNIFLNVGIAYNINIKLDK